MKKIACVIAAFALSLCLAGCGGGQQTLELDATATMGQTTFQYPSSWKIARSGDTAFQVISEDGNLSACAEVLGDVIKDEQDYESAAGAFDENHGELVDCQVGECSGKKFDFNTTTDKGKSYAGQCFIIDVGYTYVCLLTYCADDSYSEAMSALADTFSATYHDHSFGEWTVDIESTCAEEGEQHAVCSGCGETVTESIKKLDHEMSDWQVETAATCTEEGAQTATCAVCGETETESIPKLDHKAGETKTGKSYAVNDTLYTPTSTLCAMCGEEIDSTTSEQTMTMGQKNALEKAHDYLDYMAFSYSGLIEQLEYEGFTTAEATFAVDYCGADWNEQAAKKAQEYLDYMSFSRSGLIDQLKYEGFTKAQAEYGVKAVGY